MKNFKSKFFYRANSRDKKNHKCKIINNDHLLPTYRLKTKNSKVRPNNKRKLNKF